MDNIPVLKDGKANPDFLMTDEQAVAVLKVIRMGNMKSGGDILNKVISDHALNKAIKALERPQGKWCRKMYDAWECSYCHKVEYTQDIASYHYCRHCGAKMGEVTHDTSR